MITCIRDVRRARGLTLDDVARACVPPTTAQTIGRLETGTRTVSVAWLNRIAAALEVGAADLVRLPEVPRPAIAAVLARGRARAPGRPEQAPDLAAGAGVIAVRVAADSAAGEGTGYRAGDVLLCERLAPGGYAAALGRDALVPGRAGRFLFGRVAAAGADRLVLATADGEATIAPPPPWIAVATRLVRAL